MLSQQLGSLIRAKRDSQKLRQEDLARKANVSRDVLSRLERGLAPTAQADTFDKVCSALGLEVHIYERDMLRQLARQEQQRVVDQRRERHLRLAIDLATGAAGHRVAGAKAQVELWRQRKLCSEFYIQKWSDVLTLKPKEMARAMSGFGEWETAMFQNSPWI